MKAEAGSFARAGSMAGLDLRDLPAMPPPSPRASLWELLWLGLRNFHPRIDHARFPSERPMVASSPLGGAGGSIPSLFAEQVVLRPHATAVECAGHDLTYGELNARANRLAHHLLGLGVVPGDRVGFSIPASVDLIVAMLAILKIGAAYVPLDPSFPADRLSFMREDAGVSALIIPGLGWLRDAPRDRTVFLREDRERIDANSAEDPPVSPPAQSEAFVLYTSGSTGIPKGISIPHSAVIRLVCHTDYVQLSPEDRVSHLSNTSFDAATFELWGALLNGAALVVIGRELSLESRALAAMFREKRVTTAFLTTALFNQVARDVPDAFAPLCNVLFGGEISDPGAVRTVLAGGPPARLLHMYGPTECTTFATWRQIGEVAASAATIPIGRPVSGTSAHILDTDLRPVPVGAPGELYLGGAGLALGYNARPALTAERFVPDPFSDVAGARLYRTGDRACATEEGEIEFLGRLDSQVKIRGFRIEPGEVEAILLQHPDLRAAVVVARGDHTGLTRLIAYVVPAHARHVSKSGLRAWLIEKLPPYMVPAAIVAIDQIPLTPGGKVDRRALPEPGPSVEYVPPRTNMEQEIAAIWAEVLGMERVSAEDDFFELGGHSILAMRLMMRVQERLWLDVPLSTVFKVPKLKDFASRVDAAMEVVLREILADLDEMSDEEAAAHASSFDNPPTPPRTNRL